ncbi:site-specific integrase [Salmonella enterica]|nr:tyrosine-type recombinase/integrase [Salmonella enterica]EDU6434617.1 site-specific integrase [Salmonella enterica subsp. salamae serovar 47:b:e,n,x,z15]EDZ4387492.1 site-specific integrase [Salmonella enterica]EEH1966354.1 site-specific integrase [Salmonella enterica]EEJ7692637.1 site-specific integrase [Salmonella enterica]
MRLLSVLSIIIVYISILFGSWHPAQHPKKQRIKMAFYTVEKRITAKGEIRYRVTVGVKDGGRYVYRENKTFPKHPIARSWGAKRVAEIEEHGWARKEPGVTLTELITRYFNDITVKKSQSKKSSLKTIMNSSLGELLLTDLTMNRYVEYARARRVAVKAGTVATELSYLKAVLDLALPFYNIKTLPEELKAAKIYLQKMNVIGPSNKRNRRPTREEFEKIHSALTELYKNSRLKIRYHDFFEFAVFSCMRRGEICGLRWDDIDYKNKSILVRDRKDPRKKIGNHMVIPLLGRAWDIIMQQPKISEKIFPHKIGTFSEGFRRTRDRLEITDIRFHDMRREGASRLFEMGFSIEEVAQVTGHKNLKTLWTVYREIYPQTLHDRFDELQRKKEKKDV